jgi:hypothetical protein
VHWVNRIEKQCVINECIRLLRLRELTIINANYLLEILQ